MTDIELVKNLKLYTTDWGGSMLPDSCPTLGYLNCGMIREAVNEIERLRKKEAILDALYEYAKIDKYEYYYEALREAGLMTND